MTKPETWEEQRDWLRYNLGTVISTTWLGPERFTSRMDVEISYANGSRGSWSGTGITGEESIRALFNRYTQLESGEHIILRNEVRVTVNPETLKITPWQAPAANAA